MADTTTGAASATVERLDPRTLLVDANVRLDPALDKDFLASIAEHGVLVPIVAVRTGDGVRVRLGHRRTLAAAQAGHPDVPVVVTGKDRADDVARIVSQWAENEHRTGLSTADKIAAVEQLAAFGLSATQIARRTRTRKADVDAALAAAGSDLAKVAAARYEFLDLQQASVVAEFADDADAVKALVAAAKIGQFEHVAQRQRDARDFARALDAATAALAGAGIPVIDPPRYDEKKITRLRDLTHDGKPITEDSHAACPGRVAWLERTWGAEPVQPVHGCRDPKTHGHTARHATGSLAGPLTETEKAQRAQVRENNAAWRSATIVRREWLRAFLARKTAPKGSAAFVADALARGEHALRRAFECSNPLAHDLLGLDQDKTGWGGRTQKITTLVERARDGRAQVLALAVVLAAYENATDVGSWRRADGATRRYLAYLAAHGYTLSDIEGLAAATPEDGTAEDEPDPDDPDHDGDTDEDEPADADNATTR
jgi:ParB family chromosome partitioning protein